MKTEALIELAPTTLAWKPDWRQARQNLLKWWNRESLALCVTAPADQPWEDWPRPTVPADARMKWLDPEYRWAAALHDLSHKFFGGEAFPYFDTQIGPGSLGIMLGAQANFDPHTVWYEPNILDPEQCTGIRFDSENNEAYAWHQRLIDLGAAQANGRFLVGIPDLIENIDTLAALRDSIILLTDLVERPEWVLDRLWEINDAYFAAFDQLRAPLVDADGGNAFAAFRIWGPGRTAKLQCDFSCMISVAMYRQFVQPALRAQCQWLDYALYHLDGVDAIRHVDALLEIDELHAIQWTPGAGKAGPATPQWYDLLRRIKQGGKGIHVHARPEEVFPLLEAVGPEGTFIHTHTPTQDDALRMLEQAQAYRR